jgi:hypothetical protein
MNARARTTGRSRVVRAEGAGRVEVMGRRRRRRRRLARARESRRAWSRERRLHEWRTYAQQVEALDAMNYVAPAVSRDGWRWHLECASVPKFEG